MQTNHVVAECHAVDMNNQSLTLYIDTNFVGNESDAALYLRRMAIAGDIKLVASSILWREIESSNKAWLSEEAQRYPVAKETGIWGESRWGEAVWGSPSDAELLDELKTIIAPGESTRKLRDIMHIHTAIRRSADALVTTDKRDILRKRTELAHLIDVWTPEQAAREVRQRLSSGC